jgi:hypothetical protein
VWIAEVVVTVIMTASLFPMLFLYVLDLATGTVAPGAVWAIGVVIGLLGIWVALLIPDSRYKGNSGMRWAVVAALAIGTTLLAKLVWDSVGTGGMGFGFGFFVNVAAAGVALHQLVRLILLSARASAVA